MAETREFKPLKDLGSLTISETSELKFYVDEYKGYKYGSIRTFVKGDTYSGPTKSGVTLNPGLLNGVIETLSKLPKEPEAMEEKELARFPKKAGIELVVRITIFKDSTGIDLREWVEEQTGLSLGYIEQLYSFGDRGRHARRIRERQIPLGGERLGRRDLDLARPAAAVEFERFLVGDQKRL